MPGVRQAILNNLGIKVTSLVLALAVYAHVYVRQEREVVLASPLVIADLPAGLTWRGDAPERVRVRVRARGAELLKLRAQPPRVAISLQRAREGHLERPLSAADVAIPSEVDATVLGLVEPVVLSITIEPLVTQVRPVRVVLAGQPPAGRVLAGPLRVVPETLSVTGARGLLAGLDTVRTQALDLHRHEQTFDAELGLDLPRGVRPRIDRVLVHVPLALAARRELGPLPVSLPISLRADWRSEPESATVELSGPEELLRRLEAREVRVRVEAAEPIDPEEPAALVVGLPRSARERVRVEQIRPETVRLVSRTR